MRRSARLTVSACEKAHADVLHGFKNKRNVPAADLFQLHCFTDLDLGIILLYRVITVKIKEQIISFARFKIRRQSFKKFYFSIKQVTV